VHDLDGGNAKASELRWVRAGRLDLPEESATLSLTPEEWDAQIGRLARRLPLAQTEPLGEPVLASPADRIAAQVGLGFSPLYEEAGSFAAVAVLAATDDSVQVVTATWPKEPFDRWIERARAELRPATPTGATYSLPKTATGDPCLDDTWTPIASGPPAARVNHTAVWTGTEMIVWGGYDGTGGLASGRRYDPATDSWIPTSANSAPAAR
jgi:hypothetical protein